MSKFEERVGRGFLRVTHKLAEIVAFAIFVVLESDCATFFVLGHGRFLFMPQGIGTTDFLTYEVYHWLDFLFMAAFGGFIYRKFMRANTWYWFQVERFVHWLAQYHIVKRRKVKKVKEVKTVAKQN